MLEGVVQFFSSEAGLTILGGVFGAVWTAFKGSEWYAEIQRRRWARAVLALEAGVEYAYDTYVREVRAAAADGQLTEEERAEARRRAIRAAFDFGKTQGVDIAKTLGQDYLTVWIAKIVEARSSGGIVTSPFGR